MTRRSLLAMSAVPGWGHGGIRRIDPPALAGSGMPFLTAGPDGSVYLSWIDSAGERQHALRFSRWTGSVWTAPETVAEGRNWFINWADFPSLVVRGDGSMLAHWLPRAEGGGTYGYGIRIAVRDRERPQWRPSYGVSLEEKVDYAGFLESLRPGMKIAAGVRKRGGDYILEPLPAAGGAKR